MRRTRSIGTFGIERTIWIFPAHPEVVLSDYVTRQRHEWGTNDPPLALPFRDGGLDSVDVGGGLEGDVIPIELGFEDSRDVMAYEEDEYVDGRTMSYFELIRNCGWLT